MDTKENSYSSTNSTRMAGKMKQRKNGGKNEKRTKKKAKKANNFGKVLFPNN